MTYIKPLISIALIISGRPLTNLKRTIPSFLNQTYLNTEIIIINNDSKDKSVEYIKKNYPQIKVFSMKKNMGYAIGKNTAVKKSSGKYILLLDDDIILINKNTINRIYSFAKNNPSVVISMPILYSPNDKQIDAYGGFYSKYVRSRNKKVDISVIKKIKMPFNIGHPHGENLFIKKSVWVKFEGYDKRFPFKFNDIDLGAWLWVHGYVVKLYNKCFVLHTGDKTSKDTKYWCWKFKYSLAGEITFLIKYIHGLKMIWKLLFIIGWNFLRSVYQMIKRKTLCPIFSLIFTLFLTIQFFPKNIKLRSKLKKKCIMSKDSYLLLKPPF